MKISTCFILLILTSLTFSCEQRTTDVKVSDDERDTVRDTVVIRESSPQQPPVNNGNKQPSASISYTLSRSTAGNVSLGMDANRLQQIFGADNVRKNTITNEGIPSEVIDIYHDGSHILRIDADCPNPCRIQRITVMNSRFRTNEGIGIGSTVGELKNHYKIDRVLLGEGRVYARVESLNASFRLNTSKINIDITRPLDISRLPDNMEIEGLLFS
jgi:hypothetical protein